MQQWDRDRLEAEIDAAWEDWVESLPCPSCDAQPAQRCELNEHDPELHQGYRTHEAREAQIGEKTAATFDGFVK
jgi:hypothetical protein